LTKVKAARRRDAIGFLVGSLPEGFRYEPGMGRGRRQHRLIMGAATKQKAR
jgi:hypothetical protein